MLTTSHVIWSYMAFGSWFRSKRETAALIAGSLLPDVEILFWTSMSFLNDVTGFNPFKIDYHDLLHGTGISFWYSPLTHFTNSVPLNTLAAALLSLIFKRQARLIFIAWLFVEFHLLVDALSHKSVSIFFWPLRQENLMGVFDFNSQPLHVKLVEQALTFAALAVYLVMKRRGKVDVVTEPLEPRLNHPEGR